MKQIIRFSLIVLSLLQTGNVFAQLGAALNIAGHGALALANRASKQEKLIEQSSKQEKIGSSKVIILRVKDSDIKSKAKKHIIALQNRLDQYAIQYKNNQPLDIPKNDSDLAVIQDKDENWPIGEYMGEIRAYKRYAFQQKQSVPVTPINNSTTTAGNPGALKDTTGGKNVKDSL